MTQNIGWVENMWSKIHILPRMLTRCLAGGEGGEREEGKGDGGGEKEGRKGEGEVG